MKFINYLTSIAGIEIFPLISLLIFFFFFAALIVYVIRADKQTMLSMKRIPLDEVEPKRPRNHEN